MNNYLIALLILNSIWFGIGFWFFTVRSEKTAKLIIKPDQQNQGSYSIVAHSLKFLGGLNLAFAVLAVVLLLRPSLFPETSQQIVFAAIFSLAHATQFYFNVPIAMKERRGEKFLWHVLKGKMLFIFLVDATLSVLNFGFVVAIGLQE
jgi:hypothetical protein